MKRLFCLFLSLMMVFTMTGCKITIDGEENSVAANAPAAKVSMIRFTQSI